MNATWPAKRFFWAVLEAPGWKRSGPLPSCLAGALAEELPVEIASVHAVVAPVDSNGAAGPATGSVVVCAARMADLEALPAPMLSLTPHAVPDLGVASVEPHRFNLLVGAFEPRPVRRARLRTHLCAAATLLLCAAMVALGSTRRASAWRTHAEVVRQAAAQSVGDADSLDAELDRLHAIVAARDGSLAPLNDAAADLARVLAGWPADSACTTHSIAIGPQGASIAIEVEGDPARFLESLTPPPGWTIDEPRLNSIRGGTRLSLRLQPPSGDRAP